MRRVIAFLAAVVLLVFLGLIGTWSMAEAQEEAPKTNDYVLHVEGDAGIKLQMLLITKPTARAGPTRKTQTVTIPFTLGFKASSCYAWFDTLPDGASGRAGDEFLIQFEKNGYIGSAVEGTIKPANDMTGGVGDL